jgi:hypothetical protein
VTTGDDADDEVDDQDASAAEATADRDENDEPEAPPPTVPIDPHGDDPAHIPDPMPSDLQRTTHTDRAFEASEPMEGEAPSG